LRKYRFLDPLDGKPIPVLRHDRNAAVTFA